jgi:DNA-binding MarR family transcriptional regulator
MSRVTLVITSALKKGFSQSGVPQVRPAYLAVLLSLWEEDNLKMVELGRRAGLETSTMTGLLDRMERDGLVYRSPDPADRRAQRINLTDDGRSVESTVLDVVDRVMAKVMKDIPERDQSRTKMLLRQVLANAHKGGQ